LQALVVRDHDAYSHTFVRQHWDAMPSPKILFYGGNVPTRFGADVHLSPSLLVKLWFRLGGGKLSDLSLRQFLVARAFKRMGVTECFAEFGTCGAALTPICNYLGIPLVVHFHGFDAFQRDVLEKYETGYKEMFRYARQIIVVSMSMHAQLVALGCERAKLRYHPCVPLVGYSHGEKPETKDTAGLVICSVGRFVEKKAPYAVLLAFKRFLDFRPDAQLVMAGDGPLWSACRHLAEILNIQNVSFLGALGDEDAKRLIAKSSVFAQHSVVADSGDREGTPVAVMEAMALGTCVVATRHEGIEDVVEDGVSGLLVNENDVDAMAGAFLRVSENTTLRKSLERGAREAYLRLQTRYAPDKLFVHEAIDSE
jgi:colanic acid/amylovoran biosynthesis glycosyltransferase